MSQVKEKKSIIEEVDLVDDREYILKKLEESENEKSYTLEEVCDKLILKLEKFKKEYERV